MKNRLIIITGDLASGKSTLADALGTYLRVPVFKKDVIKEHYCDLYGFITREDNRKLSVMAVDFMINAFLSFASQQQNIILEANFRENELKQLEMLTQQFNYDVFLIVLRGDLQVLYKRFLDRLPSRHIAHRSMNLDYSLERFADYINELRDQDFVFTPNYLDMSNLDEDEVTEEALQIINDELGN